MEHNQSHVVIPEEVMNEGVRVLGAKNFSNNIAHPCLLQKNSYKKELKHLKFNYKTMEEKERSTAVNSQRFFHLYPQINANRNMNNL